MGAQLSVTDKRHSGRHPVDYPVIAEHHTHGDIHLHISNLSATGFMIDDADNIACGDRIIVRFPVIGRIEAYALWILESRAGFQFERIIRVDDFELIIKDIQPNPKLRRLR